jgi:hypothetical protein
MMKMAMTPLEEAVYALDNGLPRRDLAPEVQAAYDRLIAGGYEGTSQDPAPQPEPDGMERVRLALAKLEQSGNQDARTLELRRKLERVIANGTPPRAATAQWWPVTTYKGSAVHLMWSKSPRVPWFWSTASTACGKRAITSLPGTARDATCAVCRLHAGIGRR